MCLSLHPLPQASAAHAPDVASVRRAAARRLGHRVQRQDHQWRIEGVQRRTRRARPVAGLQQDRRHARGRVAGTDQANLEEAALERRSEEHTSELQSLMRISYAVFCLKKKKSKNKNRYDRQK